MKKLLLLLCSVFLIGSSFSQTVLGDSIMSDSTLSKALSPYLVTDSFYLHDTATLTMDPGVVIQFDTVPKLSINGNIKALGTLNDSIFFEQKGFNNLDLFLNGSDSSEFNYCHFRLYTDTLSGNGFNQSNIVIDTGSVLSFRHCLFATPQDQLYRSPLYSIKKAMATFEECTFKNVRLYVNAPHAEGHSISETSSYQSAQFNFCRFENTEMKTEKNIFFSCYFFQSYISFYSQDRFEYCTMENNRMSFQPYTILNFPGPLSRSDTVVFQYNTYFSSDTSQRFGIFGIFKMASIFDPNDPDPWQEVGGYAALKFNNNQVCVKGTMPLDSLYSGWDLTNNCWCETDTQAILNRFPRDTGIIINGIRKPIGIQALLPFNSSCIAEVFPGDANYDHIANMRDLLPIGLSHGNTGPIRPNASLTWIGQEADNWTTSSPTGLNDKHADCNGDGLINDLDTLAIRQNYNLTHPTFKNSGTGIPVTISPTLPANSYKRGDTVTYRIDWGDMTTAVSNAYGVTLSLQYDTSQWNSSSLHVRFPNSWLGTPNTDLLTMVYHDSTNGRLDIGWVRTDGMTRNGFGQIGSIVIVLDDDISKRGVPVSWDVLDAYAIDYHAESIDVAPEMETIFVDYATSLSPVSSLVVDVFPNPSDNGIFTIKADIPLRGLLAVTNIHGQKLYTQRLNASNEEKQINLQHLPPGAYILKLKMAEMMIIKKLVIR